MSAGDIIMFSASPSGATPATEPSRDELWSFARRCLTRGNDFAFDRPPGMGYEEVSARRAESECSKMDAEIFRLSVRTSSTPAEASTDGN